MIAFFKKHASIYHLIDLLTLYLNNLNSTEPSGSIIMYLFFQKKTCAISKN